MSALLSSGISCLSPTQNSFIPAHSFSQMWSDLLGADVFLGWNGSDFKNLFHFAFFFFLSVKNILRFQSPSKDSLSCACLRAPLLGSI